jgi:alanyl-tRNA synthetase
VEDSVITALTTESEVVQALADGDKGTIVVEETPFYATMGGQAGDKGIIETANGQFKVVDTIKLHGSMVGHVGYVTKGMLQAGDKVTLKVDATLRNATAKNHSATHLLQKALKVVLGEHVEQAGSYVDADRLRFDFTHFQAMTKEEIEKAEAMVNEQIANGLDVITKEMSLEDAKKTGAMALFGEKYGDTVRVVSMGDYSVELCGGTHVSNTSTISYFKIVSEAGISAGVRRIEALTGAGLMKYYADMEKTLLEAAKIAKSEPNALAKKIQSLHDEIKALSSENEKLKAKMANDSVGDVLNNVEEVKGVKLLATKVSDVDMNGLRNLGDNLKEKMGGGVIVIVSTTADKANVIVMADDDAISKGAHAGNMIKEIAKCVGGGGGGRPNMAQAGGKNPAGADEAVAKAKEILEQQL